METENYNVKDVYAKCKEIMDEKLIKTAEDPRITTADLSSSQEDNTVSKKRQKLHWGYDTSKCLQSLLLAQTIRFSPQKRKRLVSKHG